MHYCKLDSTTYHGINFLRGLFAIFVVAAHSLDLAIKSFDPAFLETQVGKVLSATVGLGYYWVMGFFVISGFCIQLSVQNSYAQKRYSLRNYFAARITRIVPLFYLALIFVVIIELIVLKIETRPDVWTTGLDVTTFLGNVFFAQSVTGWFGSYAPAWSITCEMAYYLLWPVALWASDYRPGRASIGAAIIALVLAVIFFILDKKFTGSQYLVGIWMLFYMSVLWFAGALVASKWNYLSESALFKKMSYLWLPGIVLVYILEFNGLINMHIRNLMLCPVFIALLLNLYSWPAWLLVHDKRSNFLGNISYPLYLLHGPLILLVGAIMLYMEFQPEIIVAFFIVFLTPIAIVAIIGIPVEVRLMTWRRNYLKLVSKNI